MTKFKGFKPKKKEEWVIGIDPDVKKSGLACYKNGELIDLDNQTLIQFFNYSYHLEDNDNKIVFVIEDGNLISSLYTRNKFGNDSVQHKVSERIGANKQRATDLIAIAEHFNIKVVRMKPQKGNWADNKKMFEKVTGWKEKSNPETRSAAYFGWLYLNQK